MKNVGPAALLVAALATGGCGGEDLCLVGSHSATFTGAKEGTIDFTVAEPEDDMAVVTASLRSDGGSLRGDGTGDASCVAGWIYVELVNEFDGEQFGFLEGDFVEEGASGIWRLDAGDSGEWSF